MPKERNLAYLSPIFRAFLELVGIAPRLRRADAIELIDGDARAWRRSLEHKDILPGGYEPAPRGLNRGLDDGKVLFLIGVQVADFRLR